MNALGVMAVSCLVGVGAFAVGFVSTGTEADRPVSPVLRDVARLTQSIDRLASENAKLREEVERLADRPMAVPMARLGGNSQEIIREEALSVSAPPDPLEGIEDRIIAALAAAKEREAQERREKGEQREQGRIDDQVTALAEQLGLAQYQADMMRQSMTNAQAALSDARSEILESGGGRQEMRAAASGIQVSMKGEFATFMTTDQLAKYDEVQPSFGGRGGFAGGRGGG